MGVALDCRGMRELARVPRGARAARARAWNFMVGDLVGGEVCGDEWVRSR